MLISQLEAKLDSQLAKITALETQILEINKIIDELKEYRNKLLSISPISIGKQKTLRKT